MAERLGNYEIIRKLAAGGMAEVLLAKHRGLGGFERLVCIKRILPHLSAQEDFLKMFQDEARIAANLVHPNIAQIYDIAQEADDYFIAMEYVRGEDLRRVYNQEVQRGQTLPAAIAAQVVMGAAAGLDYAHRQSGLDGRPLGLVHRDISPQNILVTYDGHVKLIDFGVAKARGKLNETRSGVLKGKYSYMSPEQASGDPVDGRTDIFALGITLYEVTTGTRLFKRDNELETLHAVIACNVTPPSKVVPGYEPALEAIVMRALAYDPDGRYPSAGDLERDLDAFLQAGKFGMSAAALATYMHDLFAEKLADEALFGGPPWNESATDSRRAPRPAASEAADPSGWSGAGAIAGATGEVAGEELSAAAAESGSATVAAPRPTGTPTTPEPRPDADHGATEDGWDAGEDDDRLDQTSSEVQAHFARPRPHGRRDRLEATQLLGAAPAMPPSPPAVPPPPAPPPPPPLELPAVPLSPPPRRWPTVLLLALTIVAAGAVARRAVRERRAAAEAAAAAAAATAPPEPAEPAIAPDDPNGYLTVRAPVPLQVSLGDRALGETPIRHLPLPPGSYRLRLQSAAEGLSLRRTVRLQAGNATKIAVGAERGTLDVQGTPWAWVKVGERPAAETPQHYPLYYGDYRVILECPDGRRRTEAVSIVDPAPQVLHMDCAE